MSDVAGARGRLVHFARHADFHGIDKVARPNSSIGHQGIWACVVLAFALVCMAYVYTIIAEYSSNPITTKQTVAFGKMPVPDMTICPIYQDYFKFDYADYIREGSKMIGLNDNLTEIDHTYASSLLDYKRDRGEMKKTFLDHMWKVIEAGKRDSNLNKDLVKEAKYNLTEVYTRRSLPLYRFLYSCNMNTDSRRKCLAVAEIEENLIHPFSMCYTMKPNPNMFFEGADENLAPGMRHRELDSRYPWTEKINLGVYVELHSRDEIPVLFNRNLEFLHSRVVYIGTFYTITIQSASKHDSVSQRGMNQCAPSTKRLKYFPKYSYSYCLIECANDKLADRFNCSLIGFPSGHSSRLCEDDTGDQRWTDVYRECQEECTMSCTFTTYEYTLGFRIGKRIHDLMVFLNSTGLKIAITDTSTYTTREEVPVFPVEYLLSKLGGHLGLFLGASLLSIIDFLLFLSKELAYCIISILQRFIYRAA